MPILAHRGPYLHAVFQPKVRLEVYVLQVVAQRCEEIYKQLQCDEKVLNHHDKCDKQLPLFITKCQILTVIVGIENR